MKIKDIEKEISRCLDIAFPRKSIEDELKKPIDIKNSEIWKAMESVSKMCKVVPMRLPFKESYENRNTRRIL